VKDISSGAALMASIASITIGLIIFLPKIFK
jgi:diacylglycerol kinase